MPKGDGFSIVLIEDDPGHARLIQKNLRRFELMQEIITFANGQEALDYLQALHATGSGNARKVLVFLDLNIPGIDGMTLLERIKADPQMRNIPIVILTTSQEQREISRCYELGCNVFITKNMEYEAFVQKIERTVRFLSILKVPGKER